MAQIFKSKPRKHSNEHFALEIERLDHQGCGVGRHQQMVVFVPGALPQEQVLVQLYEQKRNHAKGRLIKVLRPSSLRIEPRCPHYALCGGCNLQQLAPQEQFAAKAQALFGLLQKFTRVTDFEKTHFDSPESWGYRRVCRLAVRYSTRLKRAQIGFRRRQDNLIEEIETCLVLTQSLGQLLSPLRQMVAQFSEPRTLGHIELYHSQSGLALLLRHLAPLNTKDKTLLSEFARRYSVNIWLKDNHQQRVALEHASSPYYRLERQGIEISYLPGDFIQVNEQVNQQMVDLLLDWLLPTVQERILDLFCGLGNLSLPLAQYAGEVVGVEGVESMVERAQSNAQHNGLKNIQFWHADLAADFSDASWADETYDKVVLDPGREGAALVMPWLGARKPKQIMYISCNPVTLARDCVSLLDAGYRIDKLGVFDMFPHTGHLESMVHFVYRK